MKTRNPLALVLVIIVLASLAGCGMKPIMPQPGSSNIESMSNAEYRLKVDALLTPVLGHGEALMGHALDVVNGIVPVQSEIAFAEASLDEIKTTIDAVDILVAPQTYLAHKAETIAALSGYNDAVRRYLAALQSGSKEQIGAAADGIKASFTVLKTKYGISPR